MDVDVDLDLVVDCLSEASQCGAYKSTLASIGAKHTKMSNCCCLIGSAGGLPARPVNRGGGRRRR